MTWRLVFAQGTTIPDPTYTRTRKCVRYGGLIQLPSGKTARWTSRPKDCRS